MLQSVPVDEIRARGSIKDSDVARLAAAWAETDEADVGEVEALLRLNVACPVKDASWSDLFIEIVTECLIHQIEPGGYVTLAKMRWLLGRIVAGDGVAGRAELELIVNILDKARWAPASLPAFAISQIAAAARRGEGPLRGGQRFPAGHIVPQELDYIRRTLFAYGNGKALPITHAEAAALIDVGEALDGGAMPMEWVDLFVKALANAVLAASGLAAPSREQALRIGFGVTALARRTGPAIVHEAFPGDDTRSARGQVPSTAERVAAGLPMVWGTYRFLSQEERALARLERQRIEIITDEPLPVADLAWLGERLASRRSLNPAEAALVTTLQRDWPLPNDALSALRSRCGVAA